MGVAGKPLRYSMHCGALSLQPKRRTGKEKKGTGQDKKKRNGYDWGRRRRGTQFVAVKKTKKKTHAKRCAGGTTWAWSFYRRSG
jgi:hypothetical protein